MIELAPKATAEINPKMAPSMAEFWHIYKENEIGTKFDYLIGLSYWEHINIKKLTR
jgi:hypothetical protein